MSPRPVLAFAALVLAFAGAEWVGWWAVPAAAGLWGFLGARVRRPALLAAGAAGVAAALWLGATAIGGGEGFGRMLRPLAGLFSIPAPALLIVVIAFPMLLAWSAAALAGSRHSLSISRRNP